MKRFVIPFIIASLIHAGFIWCNGDFFKKEPVDAPEIKFMTMTLSHAEAPQPEKKIQKKNVRKKKTERKVKKAIVEKKQKTPLKEELVARPEEKKEAIVEERTEAPTGAVAAIKKASPLYSFNPSPIYPRSARQRGWQGVVELEVVVDINGNVKSVKIIKTSGYSVLDRSALKSVKSWRFSPGKKGESPVETAVIVPVNFSLS